MTRATARNVAFSVLMATSVLGCGQQGPLVLPGDARPVERVQTPSTIEVEPESPDEEGQNER